MPESLRAEIGGGANSQHVRDKQHMPSQHMPLLQRGMITEIACVGMYFEACDSCPCIGNRHRAAREPCGHVGI